jgi:hypothetical protein
MVLQKKLPALSIMCIESAEFRSLSFQDIISDFAVKKSQKCKF